jgi:hypothetical protein
MSKDIVSINILNWRKYQPRTDLKSMHWFRVESKIINDQKLFDLTASQKWVWISLLCIAADQTNSTFDLNIKWFAQILKMKVSEVNDALNLIKDNLLISLSEHGLVTDSSQIRTDSCPTIQYSTVHNTTEQNNTYPHFEPNENVYDFESLYKKYPRKMGKKKGLDKAKRLVKNNPSAFDDISKAIDRHNEDFKKSKKDLQFIQHFDTFINNYEDWLDPFTGTGNNISKKISDTEGWI